jgi:4-diphosphocytidyl-2-C-methyl-D-erythritol kinase
VRLSCEAFAKVNRSLVILGKRPDGFHELDTVFQTIDLADRLTFEEAPELTLSVDDPSLPAGEENLVIRAARALERRFGITRGAAVHLEKRIPVGGGLGGGSADAAAALRGLAMLWDLPSDTAALQPLAEGLGSDVAFFLHGGRARGTGRGERIEPLPDGPREFLVLLVPPFSLSTPMVYGRVSAPALTDPKDPSSLRGSDPGAEPDRNDLEPAAESLSGGLARLREVLLRVGATRARLSGSGSTVFGVFPSEDAAWGAEAKLPGVVENSRVMVVPTLSRAEFAARAAPRWDA